MQVVSKWHNTRAAGHTETRRVERLTRASKAKSNRNEAPSAMPLAAPTIAIDGHSLIAAQVIATRFSDVVDLSFDQSNAVTGDLAYAAALDRKIHRMDNGSFYRETV